MQLIPFVLLLLCGAVPAAPEVVSLERAGALYEQHCQRCHGVDRLGGAGPALLPESLSRIKPDEAREVIRNGRPASQMSAFGDQLSTAQIDGLVSYLYQPAATPPTWSDADIRASHRILADVNTLPGTPQHGADPLNLFVVVEAGNHHVRVLDGVAAVFSVSGAVVALFTPTAPFCGCLSACGRYCSLSSPPLRRVRFFWPRHCGRDCKPRVEVALVQLALSGRRGSASYRQGPNG